MGDVADGSFNSSAAAPGDAAPPAEKKYKPLNTTPNATKEIKVKIIPPQRKSKVGECTLKWEQTLYGNEYGVGVSLFLLFIVFLHFPLISCFLIFPPLKLFFHRITSE